MDVKVYPFMVSLTLDNNGLSKNSFMDFLSENSNNRDIVFEKERVSVFKNISNSNYMAGVLLSFRDYDAHCKVVSDGQGGYSTTIETIEDGAEYNFFIINKNTLKGLWLTYFNAASISVLDKVLKNIFYKYAEINGLDVNIGFKHKNKIKANMIVSNETLSEVLSKFEHINSVEYTELTTQQHYFTPDTLNVKKIKLSLKRNNLIDNARESIISLVRSGDAGNINISGKNSSGKIERINLDTVFRPWLTYDYDEITMSLQNFNTNNLLNHGIIAKLIACVNSSTINRRIIERL